MDVRRELPSPTTAVLTPVGRLTMTAAGIFTAAVERTLAQGHVRVVVDLAETTFLDSSGLGALVGGLRRARERGGDLRIARAGEQVRAVLTLTTMDRVLRPYGSVDDALAP